MQNRTKTIKIIFAVLTVGWCCLIFFFSSQPADNSSRTSGRFSRWIAEIFVSGFTGLSGEAQLEMIENMQFWVRKSAHFCIYFGLGFLTSVTLFDKRILKRWGFSQIFCTLYAVSDEIHQLFVEGRSCQIRDAAIDSCGAALGIFTAVMICKIIAFAARKIREC